MNYNDVVSNTFGFNTAKQPKQAAQPKQQRINATEISKGFYSDAKGKIEIRELCNRSGSFSEALLLKSNMSGKEWAVPWNREAGCYQITDGTISFVIEPAVPACGFGEFNKYRVYVIKD